MSSGVNIQNDQSYSMTPLPAGGLTTTGPGPWITKRGPHATVQATVAGTGLVSATVNVEVSNGPDSAPQPCATLAGTITLSGTTSATDGFTTQNAPWRFWRLNVGAISGTGAIVSGIQGN